jgi:uncharacterized membrane protein
MENTEIRHKSTDQTDPDQLPFVAPNNKLPLFAAIEWISLGWKDFKSAPGVSLIYGGMLVLVSYLLAFLSWQLGGAVLLLSLLSGLVFIAPVLALGLYSVSCQIESGYKPKLAYCIREGKRHLGNELIFSFVLLIVFLVWVRAGSGIHIFFPMEANPEVKDLLLFYGIGSVVGAVFASIVFCASAFSLPMMMDRKADAITAVVTSVNAVMQNKMPMLIWAGVIALTVVVCLLTAFLAMAVLMPLIGYATWHGYKQTINADMWQENKKLNEHYPQANEVPH